MLESVLADVLTRVLGQYLEGIDRDNVRFGAWSGLVELRGVALRPEALAVLFETLGMDLPVTVEAGFIGLLRLQVPWNAIGSTPVQIHMSDITIMARPVRGDGSDDSELQTRERRIKRAKLATDDAVREASWGVANDKSASKGWGNWLVSEELRAKIIDNIQIHLSDILLRFEDPFSDPRRPYIVSIVCKSLKAVSANAQWMEAFVERSPDASYSTARKLLEVKGFHVDWAPITPRDAPGLSRGTKDPGDEKRRFETPELLKQFMAGDSSANSDHQDTAHGVKSLLQSVDGSMRLRLSTGASSQATAIDSAEGEPSVDLDIRFPNIAVELNDVQYASLLQTSVYFARLSTRGFRPKTPSEKWIWAIDQMLPGFSSRREQALRLTEEGILKARDRRLLYAAYRKAILKSRRMAVDEPKDIAANLEQLEASLSYEEVMALRDFVDRQIEVEGEDWQPATPTSPSPKQIQSEGTTMGSFWQMMGYKEEKGTAESETIEEREVVKAKVTTERGDSAASVVSRGSHSRDAASIVLRVAFLLRGASVRLSQKGFPSRSIPRVSLNLHDLRAGALYDALGNLTMEAVLGSIDAWDVLDGKRMVYSKLTSIPDSEYDTMLNGFESSYPRDVSEAIEAIRSGSNPAKDLIADDEEFSDEEAGHLPGDQYFGTFDDSNISRTLEEAPGERKALRNRSRGNSRSRESTPPTFRVTESEFLGTAKQSTVAQKYVAAFRYAQTVEDSKDAMKISASKLDISVATLEAIIDGPKGSFVWGLKFWQPKGMAQDPIMSFLGAAAGARIAELRMELGEALLANKVPMEINAVILAPRFIFPSSSETKPAVVVNMGILGICTSDNSPEHQSSPEKRHSRLRYSNYVLTLDDLGMYFSPNLSTAVSQELRKGIEDSSRDRFSLEFREPRHIDTTDVERIIRPFSLRFLLQTLRDANVVQVAHAPSVTSDIKSSNIAKVRVRGNIPGLYVIVTQKSVQHFIVEGKRWGCEMKPASAQQVSPSRHPSGDQGWQPLGMEDEKKLIGFDSPGTVGQLYEEKHESAQSQEPDAPTVMASYDVEVVMQKVSVEVRDSMEVRLVTAVASSMRTSIVKTRRTKLQADFSLRSWAVTDGSRGSTAAFRRLVYAGVFAGSKGVSPPRSMSGTSDDHHSLREDKNFVNIRYTLDLAANEHTVRFRFLSLNMVCVRETYVRLASFFSKVHKKAKEALREFKTDTSRTDTLACSPGTSPLGHRVSQTTDGSLGNAPVPLKNRISVVSEFDGFSFQLVASGGAIALVEMKDSKIQFARDENGQMKAWGDFRFFSVRDWTAPISDHAAVVTYEKPSETIERMMSHGDVSSTIDSERRDEWTLSIPQSGKEQYRFHARFKGIEVCFLYRFSVVLQRYFAVLQDGVKPVVDVVMEQVGDHGPPDDSSNVLPPSSPGQRSGILVDIELNNLAIRMPRHSGCFSEALTINFSSAHITNAGGFAAEAEWQTSFNGVDFAVDYALSSSEESLAKSSMVSSPFLRNLSAEMLFRFGPSPELLVQRQASNSAVFVDIRVLKDISITLCEAQYTVLYFVLTENLVETISGAEVSVDTGTADPGTSSQPAVSAITSRTDGRLSENDMSITLEELTVPQVTVQAGRMIVLDLDMAIPSLSFEVSRGWDVRQEACKILGMYLGNVKVDFTYRTPSHMLFEFAGELLSVVDLREEEATEVLPFVVPVTSSMTLSSTEQEHKENVTVTYEKESGSRPSIVVFFNSLQAQIVPELFRDLTFLAIPGWPYLRSSAFAPDIVYLGRTMTVVLGNSQVVLFCEEDERDKRAAVLTGDFQLKMDWMRGTGAKRISLRSTQLEVSTVGEFPDLERSVEYGNVPAYRALPFDRIQTPFLYPTDSFIEYVGPEVDESGCRVDISVDSILCLINAAEIPLLRAILGRPKRMRSSYLVRREWKQASVIPSSQGGNPNTRTPRQVQTRKALENLALSVSIPAARYLITDEGDGRFVPILETRFKSLSVNAHMGSMFQMEGEVAMDLFNTKKGWWEPALESWHLAASMSQGTSGSRAIVLKSEKRLNVNITPTTVTAVITVAKSLKNATRIGRSRLEVPVANKIQDISEQSKLRDSGGLPSSRRPSVAAFLIRNELGLPIAMSLTRTSRRTTISHNSEVEVGVQTEDLVSSSDGGKSKSRNDALKCQVTIPRFTSQELSASEVGKHYVTFLPHLNKSRSQDELLNVDEDEVDPIRILWEVEMVSGVPVCTIRSLYRIVNETESILELNIYGESSDSSQDTEGHQCTLKPGQYHSLPIFETEKAVQVRPVAEGVAQDLSERESSRRLFDWSPSLPNIAWLYGNASESSLDLENRRSQNSSTSRLFRAKKPVIRCRSAQRGLIDFYVAVNARCPPPAEGKGSDMFTWVDVSLRAPIILENKLPGRLSYRITQRYTSRSVRTIAASEGDGAVLAAGIIRPLMDSHLHFAGENLRSTFLSLAYENSIETEGSAGSSAAGHAAESNAPSRFGPEINFEDLQMKKMAIVLPSAERTIDSKGQPRRDFRVTVRPQKRDGLRFEVFAGFWIRNRSDTAVQVCSRGSYYGSGSQQFYLPASPPSEHPDAFVCLEGPYLSVRLPPESNAVSLPELMDHSDWWTSPSVLEDIAKPISMNIRGRSLEIELRPAIGLESCTSVITIRNSSWICNNTASVLQWCQASAVDSHGNCRTRFLNTIQPAEVQAIHWNGKSNHEAVRLRLASSNGQSDWIWSPPIPLNIGHSRELPAKMYRPKTHEQYIARVASKKVSGASMALVIYGEDRQHPPYRIVNLCVERAVAFSQIGSHERPWLVRAGKTSRYSWDNPLVPPKDRLLSLRVLEMDELTLKAGETRPGSSSQSDSSQRHEECVLNIDIVGDRVMVLSDSYKPTLVVNVSVDGATKIVTFCEEDENGQLLVSVSKGSVPMPTRGEQAAPDPVLIVGWDDIGHKSDANDEQSSVGNLKNVLTDVSDYPATEIEQEIPKASNGEQVDTDAALFLESIGISIITRKPSELLYICFKGVLVNYEAYSKLQCLALHIRDCQADNQLARTAYPVSIWVSPSVSRVPNTDGAGSDPANGENAIVFEMHRQVTDDDIIMIKTFQGAVRPFNISFEDDLVSEILTFLSDTAIMGDTTSIEPLTGPDTEHREYEHGVFGSKRPGVGSGEAAVGSGPRQTGIPSSKRIYVHEFRMQKTSLRLTSAGSGTAVAKAAGINASARALVAVLLNVENCEFSFPPLQVQNVFDSLHHFAVLVKEYYATQLSNQRMNLLASNALVGNPAALFDAVGTGARELFNEPGKAKGSADFIAKVGRGSKSLLTQTVGGLVQSVSSIPRAVSSGLEKAVGDSEYLAERERIRGSNLAGGHRGSSAKNPAQGLATGAVSFAHGISSGVTGLIREPVQGAKQGGAGGFFKGIGKAFIGGVAKPVAGAIDLVAEPVAGLSRQIASADPQANRHNEVAVPERPPRAFRGRNQRLDSFDQRHAVGVCLYKAIQLVSGVTYGSELLYWIELSDRDGRGNADGEVWVWNVLRRYARSMPGTKKQLKVEQKMATSDRSRPVVIQTKPEKTRIALISRTDVVVVTLDCKLVTSMPIWDDCVYRIAGQGKEVLVRITLRGKGDPSAISGVSGFSVGSLISAPWDAPVVGKRRKPEVGEELVDRIDCGSAEARDDLCRYLRNLTKEIEDASSHRLTNLNRSKRRDSSSSGVELAPLSGSQDGNLQELKRTSKSGVGPTDGFMPVFQPMLPMLRKGQSGDPELGARREPFDSSVSTVSSSRSRAEALSNLENRIRRLSSSRRGGRVDTTGKLRVVIANKLLGERNLALVEGSIEHGAWNVEPPLYIHSCEAEVFAANCGPEAFGSVVYRIEQVTGGNIRAEATADKQPRVMLEFFGDSDSTLSFTTQSSDGFRADFEHGVGGQETAVFTVREVRDEPQGKGSAGNGLNSGRRSPPGLEGAGAASSSKAAETEGMSEDEMSLKQLVDIGFKFEDAVVALAEAGGDLVKAVDILTR